MKLIVFVLLLSACAATKKDFKPTEIKPEEGAILGRIKVNYNGREFTENCAVCFNSVNGPCYKLDRSGFVVMKIVAGPTTLRRIACHDVSEQHFHFQGHEFSAAAQSKTYFGDVDIDWKTRGGFKVATLFGALGAAIDQASNDGQAQVSVKTNKEEALREYREVVGGSDRLPLRQSLVKP